MIDVQPFYQSLLYCSSVYLNMALIYHSIFLINNSIFEMHYDLFHIQILPLIMIEFVYDLLLVSRKPRSCFLVNSDVGVNGLGSRSKRVCRGFGFEAKGITSRLPSLRGMSSCLILASLTTFCQLPLCSSILLAVCLVIFVFGASSDDFPMTIPKAILLSFLNYAWLL